MIEEAEGWSDALAWSNFKLGDRTALAFIYNRYVGFLYNYGRNITFDEALVEDVIQELFLGLWKSREALCDVHSIKPYLLKSLRRALIKKLKTLRRTQVGLFQEFHESYGVSDSFQETLIRQEGEVEKAKFVREAMDGFSGRQREILYLKFYQSMSYEEIAHTLGLDLKYVYNTASKAYKKLRSKLAMLEN